MASNLGVAYVQIVPSMKGVSRTISEELNKAVTEKTFKGGSNAIKSSIGGAFKTAGKAGLVAMGTVSAAITGMAAKGGFSRALNIENATAKLKGLGHSTESIKSIMGSANAAVKGTAFGLDAAATSATMLSAAGIKSGKDMTASLKSVADVATISGRSMEHVGTIFASIAARGKLQGDDLLQLTSAGVPVLQLLGDQLGKTSAEVSAMVSKGQIDFATFQAAMEKGLGGAALSSGDTFTGAMANVRAALSRIGQKVATPALESLRRIFVALIPLIDAIGEALAPLIEKLGTKMLAAADKAAGGIERFTAWFTSLNNGGLKTFIASIPVAVMGLSQMGTAFTIFGAIKNVFLPHKKGAEEAGKAISKAAGDSEAVAGRFSGIAARVGSAFAKIPGVAGMALRGIPSLVSSTLGQLPGLFGNVFGRLPAIIGKIPQLFSGLIPLVSRLSGVFRMLGASMMANPWMIAVAGVAALGAMLVATGGDMTVITDKIQAASGQIVGFINNLTAQLPGIITSVVGALTGVITQVATVLPSIITTIVQALATMLPALIDAGTQLLLGLVQAVTLVLPQLIQGLIQVVTTLIPVLVALVPILIQAGIQLFMALVQALIPIIPALINGLVTLINTLIPALIGMIPVLIGAAIQLFLALVQALPQIIPPLIEGLINMITTLVPALIGMIPTLIQAAIQLFMALVQALPQIIVALLGALADMGKQIFQKIASLGPGLKDKASQAWTSLKNAFSSGISNAVDLVKSLPGKALSALGNLGSTLMDSGRSLINGFKDGIVNAFKAVKDAVKNGLSKIRSFFPFSPAKEGPFSGKGWVLYSGLSIGDAMAEGLERSSQNAINQARELAVRTRAALGDFSTQAAFNLEARAGQSAGWSGGDRPVVVNNTLKSDDPARMMGMLARRLTGVPEVSSQIEGAVDYA